VGYLWVSRRLHLLANVQCYDSKIFEAGKGKIEVSWIATRQDLYSDQAMLHACRLISCPAEYDYEKCLAHQQCTSTMRTQCVMLNVLEILTCSSAVAPRAYWYRHVIEAAGDRDQLCGVYLRWFEAGQQLGAAL
jgi:hypothetical protein